MHLSTLHTRARHLTTVLSNTYRTLAGGPSAQEALRTRLSARQAAYLGVLTQLSAHHAQVVPDMAVLYALLED